MNKTKIAENIVQSLIKSVGFKDFVIGINNAMAHGKALEEADISFTEKQLTEIFKGIDSLYAVAKKMD